MSSFSHGFVRNALLCVVVACAHSSARAKTERSSPDTITRAELESARYATLYDAVLSLRGRWLRPRGTSTFLGRPVEVQVMVDDMRMGGASALRALTSDNVVRITFIDPVTAAQRWGGSHSQGAILVSTHADGAPVAESRP